MPGMQNAITQSNQDPYYSLLPFAFFVQRHLDSFGSHPFMLSFERLLSPAVIIKCTLLLTTLARRLA